MTLLTELPNEILAQIIKQIPKIRTTINLSQTNKQFNEITKEIGWKNHYIRHFPEHNNTAQLIKDSNDNKEPNWYKIYKKEHNIRIRENWRKNLILLATIDRIFYGTDTDEEE